MKLRIAIWSVLGALVVVVWRVYISATRSNPLGVGGFGRAFVHLTCPISIASPPHPQTFYFVLVVNAVTYALIGVVVETTRRYYKPRLLSN